MNGNSLASAIMSVILCTGECHSAHVYNPTNGRQRAMTTRYGKSDAMRQLAAADI